MAKKIKNLLVLNVGSSSLKFCMFVKRKNVLSGKCDRIGQKESYIEFKDQVMSKTVKKRISGFRAAVNEVMNLIERKDIDFDAIAHRVVHGGRFEKPCLITKDVENEVKRFSEFAPLHNVPELEVIKICRKFKKPQYAVFDTAFFSTMPEKAYTYAIPLKIAKKFDIRRYGFHGTSHKTISRGLKGKTITCHLGAGCSISAIKNGKAIDTSMGLTPLEGLMMQTRAGDVDPGLIIFLDSKGYDTNKILNHESGFKAFSEFVDIRDILVNLNDRNVRLALDIFVYRIVKYIGAYTAALTGLDNLVFTAGIGENVPFIRELICNHLSYLGVKFDDDKNRKNERLISAKNSKVKVYVIKTNEEESIAEEVYMV
jgi:acetate kinase